MTKLCQMSIVMLGNRVITIYLPKNKADDVMGQFYEVCSGDLKDNVLEFMVDDGEGPVTTLVQSNRILYLQCKEITDE